MQFVCSTDWESTAQLKIGKQEERAITAWCNSRARDFGLCGPRARTAKLVVDKAPMNLLYLDGKN